VEIKKRGADINPDDLRKALKLRGGSAQLTVIATRLAGRHRAIICRRLPENL
jgi:SAM-dependent methyltransferase